MIKLWKHSHVITYYQNYSSVLTNAAKHTYTQRYINIEKEDNKLIFAKSKSSQTI